MCASLSLINNGGITYGPDQVANYDFNTRAQYSCNTGFYLQGNAARSCGGSGLTITGAWSGTDPECIGELTKTAI